MNHVARLGPAADLTQVEAHPHAAQVFLPVDVDRYVVTVMPGGDAPDPAGALSVILPGTRRHRLPRRAPGTPGMTVLGPPRPLRRPDVARRGGRRRFAPIPPLTVSRAEALTGTGP